MTIDIVPGGLANLVGSLVIVAFGIGVGIIRPRTRPQTWFALYAIGFGFGSGLSNFNVPDSSIGHALVWGACTAFYGLACTSVVGLVLAYAGRPQRASSWALTLVPLGIMLALAWGGDFARAGELRAALEAADFLWTPTAAAALLAFQLFNVLAWTGGLAIALWARAGDARRVSHAALLSSALVIYPAIIGGAGVAFPMLVWEGLLAATVVGAACLAGTWLVVAARGVNAAAARNAALFPLLVLVVGLVANWRTAPWAPGLGRILTTAILAYAVIRHQAFGIDAKLRFGISKGTVAGVILAIVFVASEGAQALFGDDKQWLGLLAGGAVVFAIAPLQRAADRLAEKAVPVSGRDAPRGDGLPAAEEAYIEALWAASRDGVITRRKERHLARMADLLGIPSARALELREDVEAGR